MKHEIWIDGHYGPQKIATVEAESFVMAVMIYAESEDSKRHGPFNAEDLTFWGSKVFPTRDVTN